MPRVSDEVICRDWRVRDQARRAQPWAYEFAPALIASAEFQALRADVLYYYHYHAAGPPEPLAPFEALQTSVWKVNIHEDRDRGWIVVVGERDRSLLPAPGTPCAVQLDRVVDDFEVIEAERRRVVGGHRTDEGGWETTWASRRELILHCPAAPAALRTWLDARFDVAAHRAAREAHAFRDQWLDVGVLAFMQALDEERTYRLQLDLILYREYWRVEAGPDETRDQDLR